MSDTPYDSWVEKYLASKKGDDCNYVIVPCAPAGDRELRSYLSGVKTDELVPGGKSFFFACLSAFALLGIIYVTQSFLHFDHHIRTWAPTSWFYTIAVTIPLLFIGKWRGISAIVVDPTHIYFLVTASGRGLGGSHHFELANIKALVLEPNEVNPLKSRVRIEEIKPTERKPFRFTLEVLADRDRWRMIRSKLATRDIEIDPLIDEFLLPDQNDPTYTELWLEALGSVPGAESLEPLSPGRVLDEGRYRIEKQIGRGAQGVAYLATLNPLANDSISRPSSAMADTLDLAEVHDVILTEPTFPSGATDFPVGEKVVLKEYVLPVYVDIVAKKQAIQRFEQEARLLGRIDHPQIVKLQDFFVESMRAYLVLEYVSGVSLKEHVETHGPLDESTVVELGLCMVEILQHLHEEVQIIHQDFTPDNLILTGERKVKLIDFMVARHKCASSEDTVTAGKLAYMSPEQFAGESDPRGDLYALGGTLYFLLSAKEPEPLSPSDIRLVNPEANELLADLILSLTLQDSGDRLSNLSEIRSTLGQALI